MQATITYLLSEQAQKAAILATGQPVARKQSTTIDVTEQARGENHGCLVKVAAGPFTLQREYAL